jgi:dTDP-4-dehydrorhamnose reductase
MSATLILGGSGMLGSMVASVLAGEPGIRVAATVRDTAHAAAMQKRAPDVDWRVLDAQSPMPDWSVLDGAQWIINCIGITKPLIRDDDPEQVYRAIQVNSVFPHTLGVRAGQVGARVLQIATDCVYSGTKGNYVEDDPHDALDVYGKTKSLGETWLPATSHLRCSIIGPEPRQHKFLLEWFVRQPRDASVNGFTNHHWNGITTLHFARLCAGVIRHNLVLPRLQHVVPADRVSKAEMLRLFAASYGRSDIRIQDKEADFLTDRTLATAKPASNRDLWNAAGYAEAPSVAGMIEELSRYQYAFGASA